MDQFPTPKNFNDMMQNPKLAFRDAELKKVSIERDGNGLPRARAGTFAAVYRAILPNKQSRAIRVFNTSQPERLERYQAINDHLRQTSLSCLVPFAYEDAGVRSIDGKWYPLITMDWVAGETLFDWLQKRTDGNDGRAITAVALKWQAVARGLRDAKIAHGDLQHANVLVTDAGEIRLVDYDGMCVPKLVGRRNLEIGVEPYQHPSRDGNTALSLSLDNFSAIFIYVGLKSLAAEPRLWHDFVTRPLHDKILFRKEDFKDPNHSELFRRLKRSPDSDVQRLSVTLGELTQVRMEQVPFLEELVSAFDFNVVRQLLDKRDFDAAVGMLSRNSKQPSDAPPDLQPRVRDAQARVAKLAELLAAIDAGDERGMTSFAAASQLQGYPRAADALGVAKDAAAVQPVVQRLEAARASRRWRELVREWDASQSLLTRPNGILRRSAAKYAADVASWRDKNRLCDQILVAIRSPNPDIASLRDAWRKLMDRGGHPECDPHRATVDKLISSQTGQPGPGTAAVAVAAPPLTPSQVSPPTGSRPSTAQQAFTATTTPAAVPAGSRPPIPATSIPTVSTATGPVNASPGTSLVREKWNDFVNVATIALVDLLARKVPPIRWLQERMSLAAPAPDSARRALLLGKTTAMGALFGAILGAAALMVARKAWPDWFATPYDSAWVYVIELIRLGPWIVGASSLATFIGHNRHLQRQPLDWRNVLVSVAIGLAAGAAMWCGLLAIERTVPTMIMARWSGEAVSWRNWLAHEAGILLAWMSLGVVMGMATTRAIPNLGWRQGSIAGACGGLFSACVFQLLYSLATFARLGPGWASATALLPSMTVLGLAVAAIAAWMESATRRFSLELRGGSPLPTSIGLGKRPVQAGAHPKCDVFVSHGSQPVAYKYWVEQGQLYLLDYSSGQPARVAAGDRRVLGSIGLTVMTASTSKTSSGAAPGSKPATATTGPTTAGSRPSTGGTTTGTAPSTTPNVSPQAIAPTSSQPVRGTAAPLAPNKPTSRPATPPPPPPPPKRP